MTLQAYHQFLDAKRIVDPMTGIDNKWIDLLCERGVAP